MYKKRITMLLAVLLLVGLAGCAKQEEPVTLTMQHNYGGEMQATMDLLIDEFNSTVGQEEGIVINVTAISSSAELNKSLALIANGDPGVPDIPDIFTGYPKVAVQFQEKGMLSDLDRYFTEEELSQYMDAFIQEGRLSDGGRYVFPIAKSTEIFYLNQTLFDEFAAQTGADPALFSSFEGIAELSSLYYAWTDGKTPDVPNDGKAFYTTDSWFNLAQVSMAQLGDSIFRGDGSLNISGADYAHIHETVYLPAVTGGIAVYDGYSSDLSKTGDIVLLHRLLSLIHI